MQYMEPNKRENPQLDPAYNRQRRRLLGYAAAGLMQLAIPWSMPVRRARAEAPLSSIAELPGLPPRETPLFVLRDYETEGDMDIKKRILGEIVKDRDLPSKLNAEMSTDNPVSVHFETLDIELLFVPELRAGYAEAYRRYCEAAVAFTTHRIHADVPSIDVVSPVDNRPGIPAAGITAFTVHRLAKRYRAVCSFSQQNRRLPKKFVLEGAFFSPRLGAVELSISNPDPGVFTLGRKNYSIWQTRTDNLFNLMATPIEETLHYAVGRYTDRKMTALLADTRYRRVADVQQLADHWMAVEEALVGGAVHLLVPDIARQHGIVLPNTVIQDGQSRLQGMTRYALRDSGIAVVKQLGLEQAFSLYRTDPVAFEKLIA